MKKEINKKKLESIKPSNEELMMDVKTTITRLKNEGMPKEVLQRMLSASRPLGDFELMYERYNLNYWESQAYFSSGVRKYGFDGSIKDGLAFGGSTTGAILGINPYQTPHEVYMDYVGIPYRNNKNDQGTQDIFYAGHKIEPVLRDYFKEYNPRYSVFDCDIQWNSRKWKHFIANVDGLLYDNYTKQFGILEIKHTDHANYAVIDKWKRGEVPAYYVSQGKAYMEALDADFCVFFLGYGVRPDKTISVRIERDKSSGEYILDECEAFIEENIKAHEMPDYSLIRSKEKLDIVYEAVYGGIDFTRKDKPIDLTEHEGAAKKYLEIEEKIKEEKKKKSEIEKNIKELEKQKEDAELALTTDLKDAPLGYVKLGDDRYWVSYEPRETVNLDMLKSVFPEEYENVHKDDIDRRLLKSKYPSVYERCRWKDPNGKRTFKISKARSNKSR